MPETHWKKLTNPNYLGSWDIPAGGITVTIRSVEQKRIFNQSKNAEEACVVAEFIEPEYKPMVVNKTNCKEIQKITGTPYIEKWAGARIEITVKKVKAFGELVDALRVAPATSAPTCADCGKDVEPFEKYTAAQMAKARLDRYGRALCSACAQKEKGKVEDGAK